MKKISGLFAALLLAAGMQATPASALTCVSGGVTITLDTAAAVDCTAANGHSSPSTLFGMQFILGQELSDSGSVVNGDGKVYFTDKIVDNDNGTWAVDSLLSNVSTIVVGIKQASLHTHFMINVIGGLPVNGTWSVSGPSSSVGDISHSEVWYKLGTTVIPLPAAGFLLLGALGGLGFVARRRMKTA